MSYFGMNLADVADTVYISRYFWMKAGPVSGIIVIGIIVTMRFLNDLNDPILGEEKVTASGKAVESEASWKSR